MKKPKNQITSMALSALLCALCSTLIIAGSVLDILDLTVCAACSLIIAISIIELGGKYPLLIYIASSVLSFIFMPMSTAGIYFAGFFGYYPIIKQKLNKLPRFAQKLISFALFNGAVAIIWLIFAKLFISPSDTVGIYIALIITGNIFFFVFDYVLDVFGIIYKYKLSKIFKSRK